MVKSVLSDA